jgi:hypothetical protein
VFVAAPVVVTAVIVGVSVLSAMRPGHLAKPAASEPAASRSRSPATPLPADGWYMVHPVYAASSGPVGRCLSILPDNGFVPTVAHDRCDPEDQLQRMHFESAGKGAYTIRAEDLDNKIKCAAVDSPADQARIHLRPCAKAERRQLFLLTVAGASSPAVYRLASATAAGSCVGIDAAAADENPQAIQTNCAHTGVQGYSLTPASAPETSAG